MMYYNNIFFSASDDGSKTLPVRGVDNRYHVHGKLEVADHATVKLLVNTSTPLLCAGGEHEKIVLSPLPRYIVKCCGDSTHVSNRRDPSFKEAMSEGLGAVRKSLKDLIFGKKYATSRFSTRSFSWTPTTTMSTAGQRKGRSSGRLIRSTLKRKGTQACYLDWWTPIQASTSIAHATEVTAARQPRAAISDTGTPGC
jgi:hypothetical protein